MEDTPQTAEEAMKAWCVQGVGNFLRHADLQGAAATCQANGVSGEDLFELCAARLRVDLKMTPFAARKVVQARNAFLHGN